MNTEHRKYLVFGSIAVLMIALDQWTKAIVREAFPDVGLAGKSVFGNVVSLQHFENTGMSFGMLRALPGGRLILAALAMLAFVLLIYYLRRTPTGDLRMHVAMGLMGGGAGNLIDRIRLGSVTDFLVVNLGFWPFNPWPAWNVADAALVIGVGLMGIFMLRPQRATAPAPP